MHKQFDIAFSFRPGTERRYEIFCAGHLSGGQPQQLLEHAFESYIAEYYGEEAVPKVKDLGYVAVLSVLGLEGIVRPSMASEDCLVPEESELYSEIKDNLRSTFRSLESLRDLLKEAYGLEPLADRGSDGVHAVATTVCSKAHNGRDGGTPSLPRSAARRATVPEVPLRTKTPHGVGMGRILV